MLSLWLSAKTTILYVFAYKYKIYPSCDFLLWTFARLGGPRVDGTNMRLLAVFALYRTSRSILLTGSFKEALKCHHVLDRRFVS